MGNFQAVARQGRGPNFGNRIPKQGGSSNQPGWPLDPLPGIYKFDIRTADPNSAAGGDPQPVLTLTTAPEESPWMGARAHEPPRCSRPPASLSAIAERTADGQQLVLTAFDPIKGRGSELIRVRTDPAAAYKWDLSPDGTRIAILQRSGRWTSNSNMWLMENF